MNKCTKIFGPPGTGKTTTLLNEIANYLQTGVQPEEIGFVSFTKQAAEEAKGRAAVRFGLTRKRLSNFRTLHSMAFGMLSLDRKSVIDIKHYQEIARACGFEVSKRAARMSTDEGLWIGATRGDKILFLENMSRISGQSIDQILEDSEFSDIDKLEIELWSSSLKAYKNANALVDFTDMLNNWMSYGTIPEMKVLFVDEAQDLSEVQWRMIRRLSVQPLDLWLAGDDDQAIFKWSGARPEEFVNFEGEPIVLHQSYRIPASVHRLAGEIREGITDSVPKVYLPRDEEGKVEYYGELDQVDMSTGYWLILVRNNYLISKVEEECRKLGYWYDSLFDPPARCTRPILNWHKHLKGEYLDEKDIDELKEICGRDFTTKFEERRPWFDSFENMAVEKRAYYRSVLARKENIRDSPRIRISTIHGAKGGEEDNVVLLTDISTKTYLKMRDDESSENRVWYVAVTRAKKALHIVKPQTDKCMRIFEV